MTTAQKNTPAANTKRKQILITLAVIFGVLGSVWIAYEWLVSRHYESTDNAYVQGHVIQITPQVGGTVMAIGAEETDFVKAGQSLVSLDQLDTKVALDQAEANLAQTVRQVRTLYANNGTLDAQIGARNADVTRAQSELARANEDLSRRSGLLANGAVSKEELGHAQTGVDNAKSSLLAAQAAVIAAREQLVSNHAMTDGTSVEQHPSVQVAAGKVREAWISAKRGSVIAPVDGYVAKRSVQMGQRVAAGAPLMTIVPLNQVWVDANFKEVQLRNIRIGQPVKLIADLYGKKVEYTGVVTGMAVGTGAAFSLLPAQNATGNWIKVVQRVPVRIAMDANQLATNPLRLGLSMDAEIDISNQSGKTLAEVPRANATQQTQVFDGIDKGANDEVHRVIALNLR